MSIIQISNESNASQTDVFGVNWYGQTFTTTVGFICDRIDLFLQEVGTAPGNATVSIRATDGSGHPTGSDLSSSTITASTAPASFGWVNFTLSTSLLLSPSTKYAVVFRVPSGDASNRLQWRRSTTDDLAGGNREDSINSGSTWVASSTIDFDFRVYGTLIGKPQIIFM